VKHHFAAARVLAGSCDQGFLSIVDTVYIYPIANVWKDMFPKKTVGMAY
jgi:hypothetical protein